MPVVLGRKTFLRWGAGEGFALAYHATVKDDVVGGESSVAFDHHEGAAIGAGVAGELVVVAGIAHYGNVVPSRTVDADTLDTVDHHLVEDADHIASIVDTAQSFIEGLDVLLGYLALEVGVVVSAGFVMAMPAGRRFLVGVEGDLAASDRLGRGQVDGVALFTSAYVEGKDETARLVVVLGGDGVGGVLVVVFKV